MGHRPRLIGITARVDVARERRDALDQAWYQTLSGAGLRAIVLPNFPEIPGGVGGLLADLGLSGVILSGGNDLVDHSAVSGTAAPERDAFEAQLIDACAERELPVLGVCRGMQVMVCHYGGGITEIDEHVATRHRLDTVPGNRMGLENREAVNSFHGFAVREADLGSVLAPAARAPDGTIEAVHHPSLPQAALMWHPEREPFDRRDVSLLARWFGAELER